MLIVTGTVLFGMIVLLIIFNNKSERPVSGEESLTVSNASRGKLKRYYLYREKSIVPEGNEEYIIMPDKVDVSCGRDCLNNSLKETALFNREEKIILYEFSRLKH
ncbi:MAG TPA: hypothetical protein VKS21_05430 [Spirochaetota bacterium]|nr:hypothetical protein [Spirochaetota bacterium]